MHGNVIIKNHRITSSSKLVFFFLIILNKSLINFNITRWRIFIFENNSLLFLETLFFKDRNIQYPWESKYST